MLAKLMKYEIKAVGRIMLPLYGALLALAVIIGVTNRPSDNADMNVFTVIMLIAFGLLVCGVMITTFIMLITRFKSNLLGDEGYLQFTLPVTTGQHLWNKILSAVIWGAITVLVLALTFFIVALIVNPFEGELRDIFAHVLSMVDGKLIWFIAQVLILSLISAVKFILQIYAAITVGHMSYRHKGLLSFGAFVIIVMIESAISSAIAAAMGMAGQLGNFGITYVAEDVTVNTAGPVFWAAVAMGLMFCTAYFLISWVIMNKRLNLE